jgi:two-component system sensor histidine kinase YesM
VDEKTIQDYFDEVGKKYNSQFCIIDSNDNYIVKPSGYNGDMDQFWLGSGKEEAGYRTVLTGNDKMIVVQQDLKIKDWRLMGALPMNLNKIPASKFYSPWIALIVSINLIFVFACSVVLTKLIFKPLNKVQKHMKLVEDGQLIEMNVDMKNENEINDLKKVFNQMIESIKELIAKVKKEEKIIAKHELDIIQAQIQPHFLYNTLDAVSALALIGDNDNCFNITRALGNFYRNSLNSGLDLVRIKDEIECIDSYVTILNIRYDNKIKITYNIEKELMDYKILKLILQPIVENAVYHGIRYLKGNGNISIDGYKVGDEIIFTVIDDGLGMSKEKICEIVEGKTQNGKSGFGLYSSIQRISLYYDIENPITIASEIGKGTEITVRIKVIIGERTDEN